MANCLEDKITGDILYECTNKSKKGIDKSKAVIINFDDIDRQASTLVGAKVTDIVLKTGTTGYSLEWFKDLANGINTFVPNAEGIDGFSQSFLCRLPNSSLENIERATEFKNGRFVVVYEKKFKGATGADAFEIAGWENGLYLGEMVKDLSQNSGAITFTLNTKEGEEEEYISYIFDEGQGYAVNETSFNALFATV